MRGYEAACQAAQACPQTTVVSVGVQEADVYELFLAATQAGAAGQRRAEVLVRAMRERTLVEHQQRVWEWLPQQAIAGQMDIHMPARTARKARVAHLAVRFAAVELKPPTSKRKLARVEVWAVLAQ